MNINIQGFTETDNDFIGEESHDKNKDKVIYLTVVEIIIHVKKIKTERK